MSVMNRVVTERCKSDSERAEEVGGESEDATVFIRSDSALEFARAIVDRTFRNAVQRHDTDPSHSES